MAPRIERSDPTVDPSGDTVQLTDAKKRATIGSLILGSAIVRLALFTGQDEPAAPSPDASEQTPATALGGLGGLDV